MAQELSDQEKDLQKIILSRMLRLNAPINGLVYGLVAGVIIFLATNWLVIKGGPVVGPNLSLLGEFFIGYRVTFVGSLVGFFYGFITGFIFGYAVAAIYNWIVGIRVRNHLNHSASKNK
jgi:hypothetical protein